MIIKKMKVFFIVFLGLFLFSQIGFASQNVNLLVFSRDDCSHCKAEKQFLNTIDKTNIQITELNLAEEKNKTYFKKITEKYSLLQATPITLVGDNLIIGFDNPENTGKNILEKIKQASRDKKFDLDIKYYLGGEKTAVENSGSVCDSASTTECSIKNTESSKIEVAKKEKVSFLGFDVEIKNLSLISLATLLGFLDGFNPCAMWVLLTFLIALSQMKDTKKMVILAGVFILAESIMYFLILNLWSSAWDFIGMKKTVTTIIGLIAISAGAYFLYKARKSKGELTCDTTSSDHKNKVVSQINEIIKKPITVISLLSILFLAFSVNVIEFACSAGIPQTFTKILDLNNLSFIKEQFYILVYTILYMADDLLVFALAVWGSAKFYAFGAKYSHVTTIIAGFAILLLGVVMVFFPNILVF